jgi:hypothetical protein
VQIHREATTRAGSLELAPDGRRLIYRFERAWRDGTHAVVLEPLDLIARLVA